MFVQYMSKILFMGLFTLKERPRGYIPTKAGELVAPAVEYRAM